MAVVSLEHIDVDEKGVARIAGSRIKVKHLVLEHRYHGWNPAQIQEAHPHLTMSEIHAAFAYYYDHQSTVDAQIVADEKLADQLRAANEPFQSELKKRVQQLTSVPE